MFELIRQDTCHVFLVDSSKCTFLYSTKKSMQKFSLFWVYASYNQKTNNVFDLLKIHIFVLLKKMGEEILTKLSCFFKFLFVMS